MSQAQPFSFTRRLQEIGMFFCKRSPQHQTMRRLVRRLQKAGIPDAIIGAMAVNAQQGGRTPKDVDVLLTKDGLERFVKEFVGDTYDRVQGRPRRFVEKQSGVTIDCLVTGRYPGSGKAGPIAFPDPEQASARSKTFGSLRCRSLSSSGSRRGATTTSARGLPDPRPQPR